MPDTTPATCAYDPATPEGQAISDMFRRFKDTEDGDDFNERIVEQLRAWFASMGLDPVATPETHAASLVVAAFNTVFEDDPRMTIALHTSSGSHLAVTGELDNYRMRFDPAEISTLLGWLTRAVAFDPQAVLTVAADLDDEGSDAQGWAWYIGTGAALNAGDAAKHLPTEELRGAHTPYLTLGAPLVDTSTEGLSGTSLTSEVKAVITAHGNPAEPTAGRLITLRTDGTITFHITAPDEPTARRALEDLDCVDFDVDVRTPHGHLIGHITVREPDDAELVSIDDTPADELPHTPTN